MADEPRRSGRASKGQHSKLADDELPPAKEKPTKGAKGGKKKDKEEVEEEEDDSIIRCVCGATADEDGWPMICCDKCEAWQHNLCMGVSEKDDELPEHYYCEKCRPSNHKDLLAAIKRGEKPWEERILQRRKEEAEAERNKKKGKGKRKSAGGTATPKGTPAKTTPVPDGGVKRKFDETTAEVRKDLQHLINANNEKPVFKKSASPAVIATPTAAATGRKPSAATGGPAVKRQRSVADASTTAKPPKPTEPPVSSIEDLPSNRQPAAKAIAAKSRAVVDELAKAGSYRIPDGETASSLANTLAVRIEAALTVLYDDPAEYKTRFLMINNNIPKNSQLVLQLLSGSLTPTDLAEMSSDDMANEEVQRLRAQAKEEADKQAILITEQGPRMRKTHKGDELIGENDAHKPVDDASWATQTVRRRDSQDEAMPDADAEAPASPSQVVELPEDMSGRDAAPPLSVDTTHTPSLRKQSTFDINRAWSSARSPDGPAPAVQSAPRASIAQSPSGAGDVQMADPDIDRLLKDEDDDDIPSPTLGNGVVWKGSFDMAGVAGFGASARWVAGGDVGQKIPYTTLLPQKLSITGRIAIQRADEYVAGMRYSQSNDVCCLAITPASSGKGRDGFAAIWEYFHSKSRWGVVTGSGLHESVRDAYLVTLEAGADTKIPEFMGMLSDLDGALSGASREENMLILTLVVKTKSPAPTPIPQLDGSTPVQAQPGPQPQPSPVVPQTPTFPTPPPANGGAPATYPWATPLIISILGQDIHAPAVVQLFTAVPGLSEYQVRSLKDVLDRDPRARGDLGMLGEVLEKMQSS